MAKDGLGQDAHSVIINDRTASETTLVHKSAIETLVPILIPKEASLAGGMTTTYVQHPRIFIVNRCTDAKHVAEADLPVRIAGKP